MPAKAPAPRSSFSPFATILSAASGWPLQLERLGHLPFEPKIELARRCQNDGHRLGMNRRDDRVGLGRQEAEQLVLPYDRRALSVAR
jgi:hypothetical protein